MPSTHSSSAIRPCRPDELNALFTIINAAAEAYRGAIPADCWHEPYMSRDELEREITTGVSFTGYEIDGELIGIMGIQPVRNVELIRHAYVLPSAQGRGVGSALIRHLCARSTRQILVGTWAAATWAIAFYERHGFGLVSSEATPILLRAYWTISARQVETSVVLAAPHIYEQQAHALIAAAT